MEAQKTYSKEIQKLTKRIALKSKVFASQENNKWAGDLPSVLEQLKEIDRFLCVDIAKYL